MRKIFFLILASILLAAPGNAAELQFKEIPLLGKWVSAYDPLLIEEQDFSDIQNLRYTDGGLKGVNGMSKINTNALTTYTSIRNGFHFSKDQPSESHVLVQAFNSGETASKVYKNDTAIPDQGNFTATAVWDDTGTYKGRFSDAPGGNVAYCNQEESCIWGGDELRCYGFEVYDPAGSFSYDYTDAVTNKSTETDDLATITPVSATVDSNTELLLHCDGEDESTTFTDSGDDGRTVTASGDAQIDTDWYEFASGAGLFDGTGDYLSVGDHADFTLSTDDFTIDTWINIDDLSGDRCIVSQLSADTDFWEFYVDSNGALKFHYEDNGGDDITITTANSTISVDTAYHVAVVRDGSNFYLFVDGAIEGTGSDSDEIDDLSGDLMIGFLNKTTPEDYFDGHMDEFRFSPGAARFTTNFEPATSEYSGTGASYIHLASPRPLQGFKLYVQTANTTAGTMSVYYWNGSAWTEVTGLSDGTSSDSKTLAATGEVTFTSTESVAEPKIINALMFYFYKIELSECDSTTTISYCTLDTPFQEVKNIWDGSYRQPVKAAKYDGSTFVDYTLDINSDAVIDYYTNPIGAELDSLASTNYLVVGFAGECMRALRLRMWASDVNSNTAVLTVYYWDGDSWSSVGIIDDGTSEGGKSLAKSGIVSWEPPAEQSEIQRTLDDSEPYYYYKLQWDSALSATITIDRIFGIPEPDDIGAYIFPLMHQNRLFLCGQVDGYKNAALYSAPNAPDVFNGIDSDILFFGDEKALTAGASYFARYGSSLYYSAVFTKRNQTFMLDGFVEQGVDYKIYQVSRAIGCPAPLTMVVADIGYEVVEGIQKQVVLWMSASGPVLFDGNALIDIKKDVENYWNPQDSDFINTDLMDDFTGWYDPEYNEYHLCIATGSNTTLNVELVYDLQRQKWFKIERGETAQLDLALQAGFVCYDTYGRAYTYGADNNGYMYRLENGTDFATVDIVQYFDTKDFLLRGSMMIETIVDFLKLVCVSKSSDSISITHYKDSASTGSSMTAVTNQSSGYRVVFDLQRGKVEPAVSHKFRFSLTSDGTNEAFQPLAVGIGYRAHRERTMF